MKRFVAILIALILLTQTLPLNALAAAGHVLTREELAAAYALTGLTIQGDGKAQSNAVYHKGMMPNESWNAMQLSAWLDDMLTTNVSSVEDILSRASVKLAEIQENDPAAYAHFTDNPDYEGVEDLMWMMYQEAESTREDLRWERDRIEEQAGVIAEMKARMEDTDNAMFDSDRVRLSAKIEAATAELKAARKRVSQNAKQWQLEISLQQQTLNTLWGGAGDETSPQAMIGDWLSELSSYGNDISENTAPVTVVSAANTRLGRMSAGGRLLSNAAQATTRVVGQNEIALVFCAGSGDNKKTIQGVEVKVRDLQNPKASTLILYSDDHGRVILQCNNFVAGDNKTIRVRMDVDAEAQGYRSFGIENLELKLGQIREEPLIALDNGDYIYSASFNGHDILRDTWEMLYSSLNDWDFEIRVTTRRRDGGSTAAPKLSYWTVGGDQRWAEPTSHTGNDFVFKDKWKRIIGPQTSESKAPFFAFSRDGGAARFPAGLTALKSVVDAPVEAGSDVFKDVLTDGLNFSFNIPVIDAEVGLDLPFKQYLPKVSIDLGGNVTASIGSDVFTEKMKDQKKINWQSKDLRDLKYDQEYYERDGWWANYKSQFGVAYDYYKQKGSKFLYQSKLEFGIFALVSGRWEIDNRDEDVKTKVVKLRGAVGFLAKYNFSWTWAFTLGPLPAYISFTLGVTAGVSLGLQVGFSWINGEFHDWELKLLKDITITVRFSFTAQAGVGIKGFAELWVKFSASLNLKILLVIMGSESSSLTISYGVNWAVGATIFWVTFKKEWKIKEGVLYPRNNAAVGASPLQKYAIDAKNAPEEIIPAGQEPASYPSLVPRAKTELENVLNVKSNAKLLMVYGNAFVFYLKQVKGKDGKMHRRVAWRMVKNGNEGSTQDTIDACGNTFLNDLDEYAFDVYNVDDYVFVAVTAAREFDENGNPKPNTSDYRNCNQYLYLTAFAFTRLEYDSRKVGLSSKLPKGSYYDRSGDEEYFLTYDYPYVFGGVNQYYDSITSPEINWVQVNEKNWVSQGLQIYGTMGRVTYSEDVVPYGATSFRLKSGQNGLTFFTDQTVESSLGKGHDRTYIRGALRNSETTTAYGNPNGRSFSFLGLTKPKNGAAGESAIEVFDWEMNGTMAYWEGRKAVPLVKGDIDHFEVVQNAMNEDGTKYARMVFYTAKETDADGAAQDRLYGLYLEPTERSGRDMTFTVTKYTYDVTVPNGYFKIDYLGEMPYLYWITSTMAADGSDNDVWRVYTVPYDYSTNTLASPSVYAEFTLPKITYSTGGRTYSVDAIPHTLILSGTETAYMTTVANVNQIPEADQPVVPPMTLYSFPTLFTPSIELAGMVMADTVAAGDFEDMTVAVMNNGNMGIGSFDLALMSTENGRQSTVTMTHVNCLQPEKSNLRMLKDNKMEIIAEGKKAAYRNSDFDYTARKRDWVLSQEKNAYRVYLGSDNELKSIDPVDSQTQYVSTDMMMPGALASFNLTVKIPENWSGDKQLSMKLLRVTTYSNWLNAMARAAGVDNRLSPVKNARIEPEELVYELNEATGRLELQKTKSDGSISNAAASGLYANAVDAPEELALNLATHDIDVQHRLYRGSDGERLVDIIVSDYASTKESVRLTCAVYVDGAEEPYYVNLPYYPDALSNRATHTITLPVDSLVDDPNAHSRARVVISAVNKDDNALVNNEFTLLLDGENALRFVKQPVDAVIQTGEDATFEVAVMGGSKPYSYQWQVYNPEKKKWVSLKGYTTPVISRENVEREWDGARFRCVVRDGNGTTIISDTATLTVRDRMPTGDDSDLMLYLAVALAALIALIAISRKRQTGK